jgi:ABC-type transport system involved in cytochrome bd biosynthesis fused ATPase/permease subunit
MDPSDRDMLPPSQPEGTVARTSKLIFVFCMALASPFVAMASLILLAAIGGAIFGITLLVTNVPYSGLVLLGLFATAAFSYAMSGRSRMKMLRKRIAALEAELTDARIQVKELEHGVLFDKKLKSDKNE